MSNNLYIEIQSGSPVGHPYLESNLMQVYGEIPSNFEPFKRTHFRDSGLTPGVYQKFVCTYELGANGVTWEDTWSVADMTKDEIAAKQTSITDAWAKRPNASNFTAWVLDKELCVMVPPIPRPTDGNTYRWDGATSNWRVTDPMPTDGQQYQFNFTDWTWEVVATS